MILKERFFFLIIPLSSYYPESNIIITDRHVEATLAHFCFWYNKGIKISVIIAGAYLKLLSKTKSIQNMSLVNRHLNMDVDGHNRSWMSHCY